MEKLLSKYQWSGMSGVESAKLGLVCNFVSNENMPPCDLYGGRHLLTSGCDVTVTVKRVCVDSSTVLKGIGELMGGIVNITPNSWLCQVCPV